MRWNRTLIPTLKEDPSDAEIPSHRLMIRAGMIRKLASGTYTYLPLGRRALARAERIVREEMDRAGAVEILMPILQPADLWRESGRLDGFGDLMCRFRDRQGRINVLGPTHEEVVTHIVRTEIASYRQVPITLYQIQTKFRDEIRPRFGVLRSREFLMKDAYSFDISAAGMARSYDAMYEAYRRIFRRAGLPIRIVEADSGLMGGSASAEFMVPSPTGEDVLVSCAACGYGANLDRAECVAPAREEAAVPAGGPRRVATPNARTIEEVSAFLGIEAMRLIKTLIYRAPQGFLVFLVRGDHELSEAKATKVAGTDELAMATAEEIVKVTGGPLGFSGPVGLSGVPVYSDAAVMALAHAATGANEADAHLVDVVPGRDFEPTGVLDLRQAQDGDSCPRCGGVVALDRGIEVGHVFQLGTKYSDSMGANILTDEGKQVPAVMGCYGIGVNRILAACIETSHDNDGIVWPAALAPYDVLITAIQPGREEVRQAMERVEQSFTDAGWEVLTDDRDLSAGVKFKDADLIGIPLRVTVGKRTVQEGTADLRRRSSGEQQTVSMEGLLAAAETWRNEDRDRWNQER